MDYRRLVQSFTPDEFEELYAAVRERRNTLDEMSAMKISLTDEDKEKVLSSSNQAEAIKYLVDTYSQVTPNIALCLIRNVVREDKYKKLTDLEYYGVYDHATT